MHTGTPLPCIWEVAACLDPAAFQLLAISAADFPLPSGSHLLGHTSFPLGHTSPPSGVISRIEVLEYTHSGRGLLALQVRGDGTEGCVSLALGQ